MAANGGASGAADTGKDAGGPVAEPPLAAARVASLATADVADANVTIELPGVVGLLSVRADPGHAPLADAFDRVLGLGVPERLTSVASNDRRVRWMSPDEWLVSCPVETVGALERDLRDALDGTRHVSVTEISGGWCVFTLGGPAAREVLARCVPIDLDPRAFGAARVASTVFAKTGATLANLGDDRYEVVCRRSFADYVVRFVANAARDYRFALR